MPKLIDLDPVWLLDDAGRRVGFTFNGPLVRGWRQSCFAVATSTREQWALFKKHHGEDYNVQGCKPECAWQIAGGIAAADFATLSVTPSLDGSAGGEWHGFITNGQIVGGL